MLLATGDYAAAEKVFRADLQKYPLSGRSLFGLQASLKALQKTAEAQQIQTQLVTAWKNCKGAEDKEDKGDKEDKEEVPMPHAPCPMP